MPKDGSKSASNDDRLDIEDVGDDDYVSPPPHHTRKASKTTLPARNPLAIDWDEIEYTATAPSPKAPAAAGASASAHAAEEASAAPSRRLYHAGERRVSFAQTPSAAPPKVREAWAENVGTQTPPPHHSARTAQPKPHDTRPPQWVPLVSPAEQARRNSEIDRLRGNLDDAYHSRQRRESAERWRRAWEPHRPLTNAEREEMRNQSKCSNCCVM